ncbi:hypothetical protein NUSPORA_00862 [Nucleospora cyclopteri]
MSKIDRNNILNQIISTFSINKTVKKVAEIPQIVESKDYINDISTLEELKRAFEFLNLPCSNETQILNSFLQIAGENDEIADKIKSCFLKENKIAEYNKKDAECDALEIELANKRESDEYSLISTEELKRMVKRIATEICLIENLEEHKELLNEFKMKKFTSENIRSLYFMKEETIEFYKKIAVIENLKNSQNLCARILSKLFRDGKCYLDQFVEECDVMKDEVLKIIYELNMAEIVDFDRITEEVKIIY